MVPVADMLTELDATGLPLPNRPIWLYDDELQNGGWQRAVIAAAPARMGVTEPPPAGIVVGEVETYSSESPVRVTPLASTAVACSGCVLFSFTATGFPVVPGAVSVMDTGGHVEKNPAELEASATSAVMSTDPGWLAVATPFWSTLTTGEMLVVPRDSAENCRWPARQLMLVWLAPLPAKTRAASCAVLPCDRQEVAR